MPTASRYQLVLRDGDGCALPLGRVTVGGVDSQVDVALSGLDGAALVLTVAAGHVFCQHARADELFELNGEQVRAARVAVGDRIVVDEIELQLVQRADRDGADGGDDDGRADRDGGTSTPSSAATGTGSSWRATDPASSESLEVVRERAQQSSLQSAYLDARASRETSRLQAMLDVVFRAAELVAHVGDAVELGRGLIELVSRVLPTRAAWCLRFDAEGDYRVLAGGGPRADSQPSRTVLRRVFEQRVSLLTLDAERDPRLVGAASLIDAEVLSVACAPIYDGERVLGALYAELHAAGGLPQQRDLEVLESIASFAGVAISRADLIAALAQRELQTHLLVHDMKNPLSAIRGALDLLALADDEGSTRRACELIGGAHARLDGYISDILAAAQIEEGQLSPRPASVDPQALRAALQARWSATAQLLDVTLAVEVAAGLSDLRWDARLMERVLDNLLENALQHAPRSSAVIVSLSRDEGGAVHVEVRDAGPGVAPEHRQRVFEKFGRLTESSAGRGLGLYFCRLVIEAHGGQIGVQGTAGDNRLVIELPRPAVEPR